MPEKKSVKNVPLDKKPFNLDAEKSLISCLLMDEEVVNMLLSKLDEIDFYDVRHKLILAAIKQLVIDNKPVEFVTLTDELEQLDTLNKAGGFEYITDLFNFLPSAMNYKSYFDIVKRDSAYRSLLDVSVKIASHTLNESETKEQAIGYAEKMIFDLSERDSTSSLTPIGEATNVVVDRLENLYKDPNCYKGLYTGFENIDKITRGLHKSDLVLVAARPACGKTSFAMNIATNVALQGKTVAVFSLEMSTEQLVQRMVLSVARIDMSDAMNGKLSELPDPVSGLNDFQKLLEARKRLLASKLYIDDSALTTPQDIISKCRKLARESGALDLIVVDYLQLMSSPKKTDNRQQEISDLSRNMKIAAKELEVPIILLSQLSRAVESRKDAKPILSDLRESGAIEQDADMVMFLYNPEPIPDGSKTRKVHLSLAKHRNGAIGTVKYIFHSNIVTFEVDNSADDDNDAPVRAPEPSISRNVVKSIEKDSMQNINTARESFADEPHVLVDAASQTNDMSGLTPPSDGSSDADLFGSNNGLIFDN